MNRILNSTWLEGEGMLIWWRPCVFFSFALLRKRKSFFFFQLRIKYWLSPAASRARTHFWTFMSTEILIVSNLLDGQHSCRRPHFLASNHWSVSVATQMFPCSWTNEKWIGSSCPSRFHCLLSRFKCEI